jgi:hypothetical protein
LRRRALSVFPSSVTALFLTTLFSAIFAQPVKHGPAHIDLERVHILDMLPQIIRHIAFQMDQFSAGGAFQMKMHIAGVMPPDILVINLFSFMELPNFPCVGHRPELAVYGTFSQDALIAQRAYDLIGRILRHAAVLKKPVSARF